MLSRLPRPSRLVLQDSYVLAGYCRDLAGWLAGRTTWWLLQRRPGQLHKQAPLHVSDTLPPWCHTSCMRMLHIIISSPRSCCIPALQAPAAEPLLHLLSAHSYEFLGSCSHGVTGRARLTPVPQPFQDMVSEKVWHSCCHVCCSGDSHVPTDTPHQQLQELLPEVWSASLQTVTVQTGTQHQHNHSWTWRRLTAGGREPRDAQMVCVNKKGATQQGIVRTGAQATRGVQGHTQCVPVGG